jgi:hypothetical protein
MTLSQLFDVIAATSRALLRHGSWWRDVADWFRLVTSIQFNSAKTDVANWSLVNAGQFLTLQTGL